MDPPPIFTCTSCPETFASRNKLFAHIRTLHRSSKCPVPAAAECAAASDDIKVFWEDDSVVAFVKPQGVATMNEHSSLLKSDALLLSAADAARSDVKKAIPAHRLDKETGGLILCSKTKAVDSFLKKQFRDRRVNKRYMAVLSGRLEPVAGVIDLPLSGQQCSTRYEVLQHSPSGQYGWLTTVNLWPVTGRMHQLRRHTQLVGHHIIGERRYASSLDLPHDAYNRSQGSSAGDGSTSGLLYLWAVEISFPHPVLVDGHGEPRVVTLALAEEPAAYSRFRNAEALTTQPKRKREEEQSVGNNS